MGVHASVDKEYERKLTYCKRFHLLRVQQAWRRERRKGEKGQGQCGMR